MNAPVHDAAAHAGVESLARARRILGKSPANDVLRAEAWAFCRDLAISCRVAADAPTEHAGLANGPVGPAMYLAAWHRASCDAAALAAIAPLMEAAFDQIASHRNSLDWLGGFTGSTWALRKLLATEDRAAEDDFSEAVDLALISKLEVLEWRGHYDLVSGLVGIGLYALEHPDAIWRERLTGEVLRHLMQSAQDMPSGTTWLTGYELLPVSDRAAFPGGHYNLGLAHGVPGVIGFLARCIESNCHVKTATRLLVGAVNWTIAQSSHPLDPTGAAPQEGYFPYHAGSDRGPARLAWCYGDLGICLVLLRAANALGREDWRDFALKVARAAAGRGVDSSGVTDMGLCHGSAGAALIFLRLWQQCGDAALAEASCLWLKRSIAMRNTNFERTAGVFSMEPEDGRLRPCEQMGYLTGAAGVGLAVLSCITGDPLAWDAPLLTDLPAPQSKCP